MVYIHILVKSDPLGLFGKNTIYFFLDFVNVF